MITNLELASTLKRIIDKGSSAVFKMEEGKIVIKDSFQDDNFEVITMDLDDTLFYNEYAMEVFPDYISDICSITGLHPATVKDKIYSEHFRRFSSGAYIAFDWEDIVYSVARGLNVDRKWNLEELQERYYTPENVYLLSGAKALLNSLGIKKVAATNGFSKYQLKILSKLGILHDFVQVLTPDRTLYTKANTRFYSAYSGIKRLHIGDDYFFDVEVPSLSGASTIWIYGHGKMPLGGFEVMPSAVAPDLSSALKLMQ